MSPRTTFFRSRSLLLILVLYGCIIESDPLPVPPTGEVKGYRPVYRTDASTQIAFEAARPLKNPGKIFIFPPYLLVNELHEGIHFFLNSDPKKPEPIGFLKIGGNTDFVMRGNIVFANNYSDLISLNVSDKSSIIELSRIQQSSWIQNFPPMSEYQFFECVDPSKGALVGWELATITNPTCYR